MPLFEAAMPAYVSMFAWVEKKFRCEKYGWNVDQLGGKMKYKLNDDL